VTGQSYTLIYRGAESDSDPLEIRVYRDRLYQSLLANPSAIVSSEPDMQKSGHQSSPSVFPCPSSES
jgi:hypothetical protein